ncbi:hypothetical protein [Mesomycoplasma lagogenitalium]|uniref:Uncharacterized protein n=1 Tax=Mesomycoplasma lagogenitalium TaxID=171286 RepID=A0ABY8LTW0_9BACT|nr:hypothetical protein [Mesomycoplasma lagogenitalium]WGI36680.1 hypothetical protein QEG99_00120 [Mesomycoplasma lagogenitalium]
MNTLKLFAQESDSSWANNNFVVKILDLLQSDSAHIWVPIVFCALIILSFIIGFFLKGQFLIVKITSLVLTIVGSIVAYFILKNMIEKSEDDNIKSLSGVLPIALTMISLIFYWAVRLLSMIIYFIIAIFVKIKRKEKRKRKIIRKFIFGLTNAVLTVPGTLAFSNVLLVASPQKESNFNKFSKIGVSVLTGWKGSSIDSLFSNIKNASEFVADLTNIVSLLSKDPSSLTPEERTKLNDTLKGVSNLLNDSRILNAIIPVIQNNIDNFNVESTLNSAVDEAIKQLKIENPRYISANEKDKKEILTNYITENIERLYNEAKLQNPNLDSENKYLMSIASSLEKQTIENLSNTIHQSIDDKDLHSKIDIKEVTESILSFFKTKENGK